MQCRERNMVVVEADVLKKLFKDLGIEEPYPETYEELDRRLKELGK